jgi:phosphoserine aminotransferase
LPEPLKPSSRPLNPDFSSGPCAKRPGWQLDSLSDALVGRSHRSKPGKAKLGEVIDLTRNILGIPDDYRIGIVPGSDTGAVEMALWSMLGARGVDVLAWESFGKEWVTDITKQLKLPDTRVFEAPYGEFAFRMPAGSPMSGLASPSATPPRPHSPWSCHGRNSM